MSGDRLWMGRVRAALSRLRRDRDRPAFDALVELRNQIRPVIDWETHETTLAVRPVGGPVAAALADLWADRFAADLWDEAWAMPDLSALDAAVSDHQDAA